MRLRVIRDGAHDGAANMARDAALLERRRPGDDPILRLYRWSPPAVSYGYHQTPEDFDAAAVAARGWGLVRRPTGGRAILHHEELTYAVIGPPDGPLFGDSLHTAYAAINRALLRFLCDLGLAPDVSGGESLAEARGAVCFNSAGRHELTVGGRKVVGSAQRRTADGFLQHGSILTGPAHADLLACLSGDRDTPEARARLGEAVTDLGALLDRQVGEAEMMDLEDALTAAFTAVWDCETVEVDFP